PDSQIVEARQLPAAGIDALYDHDSERRHLTHSSNLVGSPVVAAVSRGLPATKRLEHLPAKSLPVEVAPDGLLRRRPARPSPGRQEEVIDFHDRRGHMERSQPRPEVIGKTALSRAAGTIDRHEEGPARGVQGPQPCRKLTSPHVLLLFGIAPPRRTNLTVVHPLRRSRRRW